MERSDEQQSEGDHSRCHAYADHGAYWIHQDGVAQTISEK
jgi:phage gp46-like protein